MATSGSAVGNGVTIGSSVNNNYIFINWQLASQNAAANTSYINWQAYFHYTQSDAQLDDGDVSVNGSLRWDVPGRVKNYAGTFVTRDHALASENNFAIVHNADGTKSFNINGSIFGSISARSSANTNFDLPSIDRSPTTPTLTEGSGTARNAAGTSYTVTASGSVNNSGPTVTYTLESSTTSNFATVTTHGTTTTSGATVSATGLNANTTYYFRIKASNAGGTKYSSTATSYGIPTSPTNVVATPNLTSLDRISVSWAAPTGYVGAGISSYTVKRSGTPSKIFNGVTSSPYIDTDVDLVPGNSYTYTVSTVTAVNGGSPAYSSPESTASTSVTASGPPYAPTSQPEVSNVGLDVTVVSALVSGNGGVTINTGNANQGYFVQYQLADTLNGTYGYNGVAGAWSPAVKMSNQTTRTHTYSLMTPAKFYKFRTYAANPVVFASNGSTQIYYPHNNITYTANFATNSVGYFLAAGGKRFDGTVWIPTQTAKRFDGTDWVPLTIAKRFDGSSWVPLS